MRLRDWLRDQRLSDLDFSEQLGVDRTVLNRWKNGGRRPSAKFIIAIAKATRNSVMPNDWFEIPTNRRRPRARKPVRKPSARRLAAAVRRDEVSTPQK
jgi:transcriptional regulator with XRE-family HTH domain